MIEGYVTGAAAEAAVTALNDLYGRTVASLEADKTFGVTAVKASSEGGLETSPDEDEGHKPIWMFSLGWTVEYHALAGDPYTAA